jgi:BlaI family transcriptional regulator, penicillinase repressor
MTLLSGDPLFVTSKQPKTWILMELYRLTRYELELMDVLWQKGEATVQEVCDQLGRPLAYTTVMTTLRMLHSKKKVLKRVKRGRAHVYQPVVSREDVSRSVIRDLQTVLFADRLPTLMLGLLENGCFSQEEVDALTAALERVESRENNP